MCGILGLIKPNSVDESRFERALAQLSHRGPETSNIENLGNVMLGFARLAVQDLTSAGDQPMCDSSSGTWIVFSGEIYNFKELRPELELAGCVFRSGSDTEVILQGYLTWGWDRMLERLDGMFAMAILDQRAQRMYLVRDRLGLKPLFYSDGASGFIFASEIKAITAYIGPRPLDRHTSLNPILMTGLCPPGTTMFEGIRELEPGCFIDYDLTSGGHQIHRYFDISSLASEETYREMAGLSPKEIVARFREAMETSVRYHLISDAKLGFLFSAGLDSSLVAAVASEIGHSDMALYYFFSAGFDDSTHANSFQRKFSVDLKSHSFDEHNLIFDLPRMIYNYETINKEEGPVLAHLCKAAREDGYKVLLTGEGADEAFGGYSTHWSFYTRSVLNNNRISRRMVRGLLHALPGLERIGDLPRETDYFLAPPDINLLGTPFDIAFYGGSRSAAWQRCLEAFDFLQGATERDTAAYMLDEVGYRRQRYFIRADRVGMMESIELRQPYLHLPLLRLAVNTPIKWRIGRSIISRKPKLSGLFNGKKIVREVAKSYDVPKNIIYRKKTGTPFDGRGQVIDLLKTTSLTNVSDFF